MFYLIYLRNHSKGHINIIVSNLFIFFQMADFIPPNIQRHPPTIPAGYGSELYPQATWFSSSCDWEQRLHELAMTERSKEITAIYDLKADNYRAIRARYQTGPLRNRTVTFALKYTLLMRITGTGLLSFTITSLLRSTG